MDCEICGSDDAALVIDPYLNEIEEIEELRWLCPRCLEERAGDI